VRLAEELHSWYKTTKDKHKARAHLLWWLGCVAESGIEELKEAAKAIRMTTTGSSRCPQPVEVIRLTSLSVFFTVILSM